MKRAILLLLAALTAGALMGCSSESADTTTTTASSPSLATPAPNENEEPSALLSAEGVLTCSRDKDAVTVKVTLADAAGEEISLIALTDPAYRLKWWENDHAALSDLGQLSLDASGKGTLTLHLKENTTSFCLILTAPCGTYLLEVN